MFGDAYLIAGLEEDLVVFAECHAEYDGGDILEAVYPLLALTSLSANVKHAGQVLAR